MTCPAQGDTPQKWGLRPHALVWPNGLGEESFRSREGERRRRGPRPIRLVGGVTAHQGDDR
jgi:hypothetical protein